MMDESNKSKIYCSVYGCKSYYNSPEVKAMHGFPKKGNGTVEIINKMGQKEKIDRQLAWIKKLKMGKDVSNSMKVCSLHFSEENYIPQVAGKTLKRHVLKSTAIPDQNLPTTPIHGSKSERKETKARKIRKLFFDDDESVQMDSDFINILEAHNHESQSQDVDMIEEETIDESILPKSDKIPVEGKNIISLTPEISLYRDFGVDVNISAFVVSIRTDSQLNTFTGLQSFEMLDALLTMVRKVRNETNKFKISMRDRILLTLMKLKQNCSFVMLGLLFSGITGTTCKNIFVETILALSACCKAAIPWPSYKATLKLLPKCFEKFKKVQVVLDCTEIFVEKPKCLQDRIKTYSHYKSNNTIKFMTGVSPDGQIIFISQPYGGRASDKAIFEQSKLVERLEPTRDEIMVDKGFLVDEVSSYYGIKLVRPPFMRSGKTQFTKQEAIDTRNIAKARVHVERTNQRIKIFKIFSGKYSWSLLPVIGDAFTVVCALVNVSSPVLADKRLLHKI